MHVCQPHLRCAGRGRLGVLLAQPHVPPPVGVCTARPHHEPLAYHPALALPRGPTIGSCRGEGPLPGAPRISSKTTTTTSSTTHGCGSRTGANQPTGASHGPAALPAEPGGLAALRVTAFSQALLLAVTAACVAPWGMGKGHRGICHTSCGQLRQQTTERACTVRAKHVQLSTPRASSSPLGLRPRLVLALSPCNAPAPAPPWARDIEPTQLDRLAVLALRSRGPEHRIEQGRMQGKLGTTYSLATCVWWRLELHWGRACVPVPRALWLRSPLPASCPVTCRLRRQAGPGGCPVSRRSETRMQLSPVRIRSFSLLTTANPGLLPCLGSARCGCQHIRTPGSRRA